MITESILKDKNICNLVACHFALINQTGHYDPRVKLLQIFETKKISSTMYDLKNKLYVKNLVKGASELLIDGIFQQQIVSTHTRITIEISTV